MVDFSDVIATVFIIGVIVAIFTAGFLAHQCPECQCQCVCPDCLVDSYSQLPDPINNCEVKASIRAEQLRKLGFNASVELVYIPHAIIHCENCSERSPIKVDYDGELIHNYEDYINWSEYVKFKACQK